MRFLAFSGLLLTTSCVMHFVAPPRRVHHETVDSLIRDDWEFEMRESPTWASELGDMRYADRWPDVSLQSTRNRREHDGAVLFELQNLRSNPFKHAEHDLSGILYEQRLQQALKSVEFHLEVLPINQRGGLQTADEIADALPFKTDKDFADWNARLRSFGTYTDQTIAQLGEGVRLGMTHPRVVMERVTRQIQNQIVGDPKKSPFFAPYVKNAGHEAAARDAEFAIRDVVVPAFERLREFWVNTYLPACKPEVGAWQWPQGADIYAHLVKVYTTLDVTPDQVHAIGLREVARIRGEMEKAKERAGFKGTSKELFTFLRTDKQFYYADAASLFEGYKAVGKRIDPLLPRLFSKLPKTPYTVQAIPDNVAPDTTTAYYREPSTDGARPGTYFVNLYKPESRPKWEMMALTLHESVPGHHLQIAIAQENTTLPMFRRHGEYTAFVEGWALYAESLGDELGLYDDPWSKIGQLTYEMWRAVRLVVDTGIHHLKWDRQRAIDFFMENAPKAQLDVENEVDRYIVWPGQALAYKMGELKIKELRAKTKLDPKAFHAAILEDGPLPLDVLEQRMKDKER